MVTPVRTSRRISSVSRSPSRSISNKRKSRGKSTENRTFLKENCFKFLVSVRFIEENEDLTFAENPLEEIFKPVDEETTRIRELIRNRKATPYSKSNRDLEDDDEGENQQNESLIQNNDEENEVKPLQIDFSQVDAAPSQEPEVTIKKVIDPNVRGHGNYAFVELSDKSAQKIGSKKAVTPLKMIPLDKVQQASGGIFLEMLVLRFRFEVPHG